MVKKCPLCGGSMETEQWVGEYWVDDDTNGPIEAHMDCATEADWADWSEMEP